MNLLRDSILLGPIRLLLLCAVVLFVHQIVTRQSLKNYNLGYILKRFTVYGSAIVLFIFVLIQLNMYDVFSLLSILFIIIGIKYLGAKNILHLKRGVKEKRQSFLTNFFRFMEQNHDTKKLVKKNLSLFYTKKVNYVLVMVFGVSLATFISRYMFLSNDLYTLSGLWIKNLETIKSFNSNVWFQDSLNLKGELAFISFYGKITGISEEMAIYSFGLLENFGLTMILYWVVVKITKSKFVAPIVTTLVFAFFYKYLPININLLLQHSPLFLALCFALPLMLFTVLPKTLITTKREYTIILFIIYTAIGFINFFVLFVVIPIFLIVAIPLSSKRTVSYALRSLLAYVLGALLVIGIHSLSCYYTNISFIEFLRTNMILVDSYTHFPQLITSEDTMLFIYRCFSGATLLLLLPMLFKNAKKWKPAVIFVLFFILFLAVEKFDLMWVDLDLYYQSLSALIVIVLGVFIGTIVHYLRISISKKPKTRAVSLGIIYSGLIVLAYLTNGFFNYDFQQSEEVKVNIVKAYSNLSSENMPYSYAVVNQNYGQNMSKNEHHFINYNNFISGYFKRDSVYQRVKEDKIFLKKNPEYILPQSVFIFISKASKENTDLRLITPLAVSRDVEKQLQKLRKNGRKIHIFYEDKYLTIYEIINQKESSKLSDLIFKI
ncbi:MAG: hypothetical protein V3U92_15580 [Cellulophaga sp.]